MSKSFWTFALASAAVGVGVMVGALAFVESKVGAGPGAARSPALAWMPETAGLVGHVDLEAVSSSPLSEIWTREARSREELDPVAEVREATGIDLWNDIDDVTFSVALPSPSKSSGPSRETGRKRPFGMAISGRFDAERLVRILSEHEGGTAEEVYQGTTIYRLEKDGGRDTALALASDSLLLLGSRDYLREMIDCGQGRRPSASGLVENWGYGDFAGDAFWIAGRPTGVVDSLVGLTGGESALRSFALSGRVETDLSITARGKAADAEAARKLADVLRGFVALGRLHQSENPQIAGIADAVEIDLLGDEIHVGLNLPYDTVRDFFAGKRKAEMGR